MIKGITFVRPAGSAEAYEALASFLSVLGFEPGEGWDDERSRGTSFLAPLGNLEIVDGAASASAGMWIEVRALDDLRRLVECWLAAHSGAAEGTSRVAAEGRIMATEETFWKARAFTVEPVSGHSFTFWEWLEPMKGRAAAVEGELIATGMRFAIVVSRWNSLITDRLLQGALDCLYRSGAAKADVTVVRVPGAWEIPAAAQAVAAAGRVEAVITLGCLLRGETAHFEAIYNEVARGVGESQLDTHIPHSFGVLTCDTLEQALDRAGLKSGNKGFEAASAAIEMVSLGRKISGTDVPHTRKSGLCGPPGREPGR
ncbi:MAG: 6,7-dimethyl-8-ribityllumazine synthase [Acidobacteriaceae bacterium]